MRMKSKRDITEQINRIYSLYKDNRRYNKAQNIVLRYNYNMSVTDTNKELFNKYMECVAPSGGYWDGKAKEAAMYLEKMAAVKYPITTYAK